MTNTNEPETYYDRDCAHDQGVACVVCSRKVGKNPMMVQMSTAWRFLPRDFDGNDPFSQGFWPIGPECYKKHLAFFEALGYDIKKDRAEWKKFLD